VRPEGLGKLGGGGKKENKTQGYLIVSHCGEVTLYQEYFSSTHDELAQVEPSLVATIVSTFTKVTTGRMRQPLMADTLFGVYLNTLNADGNNLLR
jgi:hypothetical protein